MTHKSLNRLGPGYLPDLLTWQVPLRNFRFAGSGLLAAPCLKTMCGEFAFSFHASQIWNKC